MARRLQALALLGCTQGLLTWVSGPGTLGRGRKPNALPLLARGSSNRGEKGTEREACTEATATVLGSLAKTVVRAPQALVIKEKQGIPPNALALRHDRRRLPGSPTASAPRSPRSPPPRRSDLPRSARRAQPAGAAAAAEKRRQLPSPAASRATAGSREGLPERGGAGAPRLRLPGPFFWAAGPCVPRGVRPPPASGRPQRHHPFASSPVPELRLHSLEPRRGHASPGGAGAAAAAAGQPFPRGRRRTGCPEAAGTGGEGTPPLMSAGGARGGLRETGPRGTGLKPASARRARKFIVCLGRRRRRRRRAGSAAGSEAARSLRRPGLPTPSPAAARAARPERGGAPEPGAASQTSARRSSPPPPPRLAPNLYLRSRSPAPEPLRLGLRRSAPSPAPRAPHPGRVNLTPRAQGGKVWE
ncbi:serine/arginine repetitive matrix protein 1-like [Acinonyx jubatus]|uniref:Serine/arginine repetitive matrix protein 1-like n=1 Tax=Acinonyx jubatus TaxID=32536 RepID=A0ABM3NUJ3_ACIJB|nr:serine/arginine repetitive matrix protein 1-like [Acinonyx jubatus]